MRSRIYEIKLHFPELVTENGNPTITVYADRSVELHPVEWAQNWNQPTRNDAVKTLVLARQFGYEIERRFI
jgi:hypothetical protein